MILIKEIEVEKAYLGNIMVHGGSCISSLLEPKDFYVPNHQLLYNLVLGLHYQGEAVDAVVVAHKDKSMVSLANELMNVSAAPSSNPSYAKIIKDASKKRDLIRLAADMVEEVKGAVSVNDIADRFTAEIGAITRDFSRGASPTGEGSINSGLDLCASYFEHIESLKQGGMTTGISGVDEHIRCVARGEVMTVIARPGCFKTALLQHMMLQYADKNKDNEVAVFFSLEMPLAGVYERFSQNTLLQSGAEIEKRWLMNTVNAKDVEEVNRRIEGIYVVATRPSIAQMSYLLKMVEKKSGKKVGFVGVDYLGLVETPGKSEYERASQVAVDMKVFAKNEGVPVVMLAQLNRTAGDGTTPVTLDMARGSGQIEEAADFVIGINKSDNDPVHGHITLNCGILKNRKGAAGNSFPLMVNPATMSFETAQYTEVTKWD